MDLKPQNENKNEYKNETISRDIIVDALQVSKKTMYILK